MARRRTRTTPERARASAEPSERPAVVHSSLYLPEPVYETLRKVAFEERVKIHDLVMEGIDAALRRRGYPSIQTLKAAKKGRRLVKHSSSDGQ
jgi:hypothetical protein